MNMNNKGFTLIELIATIALLAVISLISYVSISKVLEQSRVNDCETIVNNIKSAVKECISDNRYDGDVNNCNEVNYLINKNYLSGQIMSPFDKNIDITNSINISYQVKDDFTCCKPNTLKVTASGSIEIGEGEDGKITCSE